MMATEVHPTAIVHEGVELGEGVSVGPYCVLGKGVKIGNGTRLLSHVCVEGRAEMGEGCTIFPYVSIGFAPQDVKYKNEDTSVRIGNNNVIREYVSIHRASVGGNGVTLIGDNNFLMNYVHVAHDCHIHNSVVVANSVAFAGHVEVEDYAFIGGFTGVHQHARIGAYAMVAAITRLSMDVPPYVMVKGTEKARLFGLNVVGLKRRGFSEETIGELKAAYKLLFRDKLSLKDAMRKIQEELPYTDEIKRLIEFIQQNKRGICR
ncbi:MAG: acyl-ACP--UDP-N-acetylglucosamine O-acyltransferase [Nitrospirota bacterium]|jgi:UDP-N-acetylglucosamine acyltransferase